MLKRPTAFFVVYYYHDAGDELSQHNILIIALDSKKRVSNAEKNVQDALNKQMNAEFYSEYLYLSMAAYFESKALHGSAHWMLCQTQEEHMHGMKFFNHISDRGGKALVSSMEGPPTD